MNPRKNWYCDKDKCTDPNGEVRVYPIGGGGNMILCHACWTDENRYRFNRGKETKQPENWPQLDWAKAEVYQPSSRDPEDRWEGWPEPPMK